MNISPKFIRDYCLKKFKGNYKLSSSNTEMIVPSVFVDSRAEQWNRHMSINLNNGLWQCFKSGNNGNFIRLYAKLEKIAYAAAYRNLLFQELLNEKSKGGWEQALPPRQEHKANEYLAETGAIPIAVNTSCR